MTFNRYYEICNYVTDGATDETIQSLNKEERKLYDELKKAKDDADRRGEDIFFDAPFELFEENGFNDGMYNDSVDEMYKKIMGE